MNFTGQPLPNSIGGINPNQLSQSRPISNPYGSSSLQNNGNLIMTNSQSNYYRNQPQTQIPLNPYNQNQMLQPPEPSPSAITNNNGGGSSSRVMSHQSNSLQLENDKNNKLNVYKQDLLYQIQTKKLIKEEERRKQIEEDRREEQKLEEYWKKKKEHNSAFMKNTSSAKYQQFQESDLGPEKKKNEPIPEQTKQAEANVYQNQQIVNNDPYQKSGLDFLQNSNVLRVEIEPFKPPQLDRQMRTQILKDELSSTLLALRKDLGKTTLEVNGQLANLKNEVKEAIRLKEEAETELFNLRSQLDKKRVMDSIFEQKFRQVLDKHAPYNNMHIPIAEVHPIEMRNQTRYIQQGLAQMSELKSDSEFLANEPNLNMKFSKEKRGIHPPSYSSDPTAPPKNFEFERSHEFSKSLEGISEFQSIPEQIRSMDYTNRKDLGGYAKQRKQEFEEEASSKRDFIDKLGDVNQDFDKQNELENNANFQEIVEHNNRMKNNSTGQIAYKPAPTSEIANIDKYLSSLLKN